jgi:hypothetical protein
MSQQNSTSSSLRKEVTIAPRSTENVFFSYPIPVQVESLSISKAEAKNIEVDIVLLGTRILCQSVPASRFADDLVLPQRLDVFEPNKLFLVPGMDVAVSLTNWRKTKSVSFWIRLNVYEMPQEFDNPNDKFFNNLNKDMYAKILDTKNLLQSINEELVSNIYSSTFGQSIKKVKIALDNIEEMSKKFK